MCPQNVCKIVCVAGLYVVFYVVQLAVLLLNAVHPSYTRLTPVLHPSYTRRTPAPADFSNTRTYTRAISGYGYYPYPRIFRTTVVLGYGYYPYPYPSPKPRGGHASGCDPWSQPVTQAMEMRRCRNSYACSRGDVLEPAGLAHRQPSAPL